MVPFITFLLSHFIGVAHAGEAAVPDISPQGSVTGGHNAVASITSLSDEVFTILTLLAGAAAVLYLIWYGIQYITSAGDPAKTKAARTGIMNAIIGIIVVVAAYGIIRLATVVGTNVNNRIQNPTAAVTPPTTTTPSTGGTGSAGGGATTGGATTTGGSGSAANGPSTVPLPPPKTVTGNNPPCPDGSSGTNPCPVGTIPPAGVPPAQP